MDYPMNSPLLIRTTTSHLTLLLQMLLSLKEQVKRTRLALLLWYKFFCLRKPHLKPRLLKTLTCISPPQPNQQKSYNQPSNTLCIDD